LGKFASTSSVVQYIPQTGTICLDEVREVIHLSKFDEKIAIPQWNPSAYDVDAEVLSQLRLYIQLVAQMYHRNPFHNFEHACHVTLSVTKLLKRIVSPEQSAADIERLEAKEETALKSQLHASTYGISSDPLAQFAIVFSALIHDVDHRGCSNAQLGKEEVGLAVRYRNKSIAEQNSLDLAWTLLMSQQFDKLRKSIFASEEDLLRFRQIIVNSVLATDIFDKELNDLRKLRWTKAFSGTSGDDERDLDRKATIVIEHIIQASDVSHTMQHWQIYRKWNTQVCYERILIFIIFKISPLTSHFDCARSSLRKCTVHTKSAEWL
jgi:3'5'-cyclic nucleotide phosphodiesterase